RLVTFPPAPPRRHPQAHAGRRTRHAVGHERTAPAGHRRPRRAGPHARQHGRRRLLGWPAGAPARRRRPLPGRARRRRVGRARRRRPRPGEAHAQRPRARARGHRRARGGVALPRDEVRPSARGRRSPALGVRLRMAVTGGLLAEAEAAVAAASTRARVDVRELTTLTELQRAESLLSDIWGRPRDAPTVPSDLLRAFSTTGNYVAGAWRGDELIAAAAGIHGRRE